MDRRRNSFIYIFLHSLLMLILSRWFRIYLLNVRARTSDVMRNRRKTITKLVFFWWKKIMKIIEQQQQAKKNKFGVYRKEMVNRTNK